MLKDEVDRILSVERYIPEQVVAAVRDAYAYDHASTVPFAVSALRILEGRVVAGEVLFLGSRRIDQETFLEWIREFFPALCQEFQAFETTVWFDEAHLAYLATLAPERVDTRMIREVRVDREGALRLQILGADYSAIDDLRAGVRWEESSGELVCSGALVERPLSALYRYAWMLLLQFADHALILDDNVRTYSVPEHFHGYMKAFDARARAWFGSLPITPSLLRSAVDSWDLQGCAICRARALSGDYEARAENLLLKVRLAFACHRCGAVWEESERSAYTISVEAARERFPGCGI